jgi:Na+/melibiose symporter-like transporter
MILTGNINKRERTTFLFHFSYSLIEGIISGVLVLNEFVFLKSLQGSPYQVGLLFKFSMVVLLAAIFINEGLHRVTDKKKMIRLTAVVTRLPLLALLFFPRNIAEMGADTVYHYLFLLIFLIYYLASPVIFPAINLLLKHNYSVENFGNLYSWATSAKKITTLIATFLFGFILDIDPYAFKYIYPLVAILGITSIYMLSSINYNPDNTGKNSDERIFRSAIKRVVEIFRTNRPYLHYQMGFMLYGIAFMGTNSVITIFYDRAVGLNYSSVAFYKNFYNLIAIFLLPVFGKMLAHTDPRKFASLTYAFLGLYLLSFPATLFYPGYVEIMGLQIYYMLMAGVLFNSGFIATMAISWSIGSAYFCNANEAGDYQSVHLSLTGLRAMFIPLAGVFLYDIAGFTFTFVTAAILLLAGISLMEWSGRKYRLNKSA